MMGKSSIAEKWRLLSGEDHWRNLLQPLDIDLRRYIIHYGERAQAAYDTFNFESRSKYAGSSIYARKYLFENVGLEKGNPYKYDAVKYLYATSKLHVPGAFIFKSQSREVWSKDSNFIGYVAVATDEGKAVLGRRDILVAWRGTVEAFEWVEDLNFELVSGAALFGEAANVKLHSGWLSIYTSDDAKSKFNKASARHQVLDEIKRLIEKFKDEEISITLCGHSLGAALAVLSAVDIAANAFNKPEGQPNKPCLVTVFAFGCPRIGDANFLKVFQSLENLRVLKIRNALDVVPLYPFVGYSDVGDQLLIDTQQSTYLKEIFELAKVHEMESAYLHGVAGTQGLNGGFRLEVKRSIALANKFTAYVKDEYLIPTNWWNLRNKGMIQNDDGSWSLDYHDRYDYDDDRF